MDGQEESYDSLLKRSYVPSGNRSGQPPRGVQCYRGLKALEQTLLDAGEECDEELFEAEGAPERWGDKLNASQILEWETTFKELAEGGELDLFTCLALVNGSHGIFKAQTVKLLLATVFTLLMQLAIPYMMITYRMEEFRDLERPSDFRFRLTGFIVYLYSIKNMHDNALDECRTSMMNLAVHYPLSFAYIWPAVFGEIVNSFVSLAMSATLFINFLGQSHPADLVINAVSLNFLGNIDNELVDDQVRSEVTEIFEKLIKEGAQEVRFAKFVHFTVKGICYFLLALRIFGTCLGGLVFSLIFLFAKEIEAADWVCAHAPTSVADHFGFC